MPYLHWEEDRKREKVARIIEDETSKRRTKRETDTKRRKDARIQERTLNGKPLHTTKYLDHSDEDPMHAKKIREAWEKNAFGGTSGRSQRTFNELAGGLAPGGLIQNEYHTDGRKIWYVAKLESSKHGRLLAVTKLGQFFLDAARLYDAITMHRDQTLLEDYLHHNPPIHPRRTLDQSYYLALKTTKARDQAQVVFKGTTMDGRNMHRFREEWERHCPGAWNCVNKKTVMDKVLHPQTPEDLRGCNHRPKGLGNFRWDNHWKSTDVDGCDHCRREIGKVGKLIMVDQLWMWILDGQTIITSFPGNYGRDENGFDVHRSIRDRIRSATKNKIRSVFDLGLIIFDECANGLLSNSLDSVNKSCQDGQ